MRLYAIRMKANEYGWRGYVTAPCSLDLGDRPYLFNERGLELFRASWAYRNPAWLKDATVEVWEATSEMPYTLPVDPVEKQEETPKTPVNIDPLTNPEKPDIVTA
jgi:hypothetical protein